MHLPWSCTFPSLTEVAVLLVASRSRSPRQNYPGSPLRPEHRPRGDSHGRPSSPSGLHLPPRTPPQGSRRAGPTLDIPVVLETSQDGSQAINISGASAGGRQTLYVSLPLDATLDDLRKEVGNEIRRSGLEDSVAGDAAAAVDDMQSPIKISLKSQPLDRHPGSEKLLALAQRFNLPFAGQSPKAWMKTRSRMAGSRDAGDPLSGFGREERRGSTSFDGAQLLQVSQDSMDIRSVQQDEEDPDAFVVHCSPVKGRPPQRTQKKTPYEIFDLYEAARHTSKPYLPRLHDPHLFQPPYYTHPSMQEMLDMAPEGIAAVSSFVVGRRGIASIVWRDTVNLTSLDVASIVNIDEEGAGVYDGFGDKEPPPGQGLNCPALVRVENVHPDPKVNGCSNEAELVQHLQQVCKDNGSKFSQYIPEQQTWHFSVEHFSRYKFKLSKDGKQQQQPSPSDRNQPRAGGEERKAREPSRPPAARVEGRRRFASNDFSSFRPNDPLLDTADAPMDYNPYPYEEGEEEEERSHSAGLWEEDVPMVYQASSPVPGAADLRYRAAFSSPAWHESPIAEAPSPAEVHRGEAPKDRIGLSTPTGASQWEIIAPATPQNLNGLLENYQPRGTEGSFVRRLQHRMMEENGRQTLNLCSRFEASFELWRSARPGISRSGHVAATLFARPPQAAADFARVAPAFPSMPRSLWLSQEAYAAACFSHVAEQLQQMAEGWDATASTKAIMGPLAKQSTKQQLQLSGTRDSPARTFNSWFWRRSVNMRALWGMLNALLADEVSVCALDELYMCLTIATLNLLGAPPCQDARRGAPVEQLAYAKLGRWLKNYAPLREDWSREHMPWPKKETQEEQILQFLLAGNVQEAVKVTLFLLRSSISTALTASLCVCVSISGRKGGRETPLGSPDTAGRQWT